MSCALIAIDRVGNLCFYRKLTWLRPSVALHPCSIAPKLPVKIIAVKPKVKAKLKPKPSLKRPSQLNLAASSTDNAEGTGP